MSETLYSRQLLQIHGMKALSNFAGVTNIASGDTSVVVNSTLCKSGNVIQTGLGVVSVASHQPLQTSVNSVVEGQSMVLQVNEATVASQQVTYMIIVT